MSGTPSRRAGQKSRASWNLRHRFSVTAREAAWLLKQKAAALGVDVNRIPDPAWHAIVDMSIASAKDRALCARSAADQPARYWKANLAGALEEEAVEISKFMQGSACSGRSVAPHILLEYRV